MQNWAGSLRGGTTKQSFPQLPDLPEATVIARRNDEAILPQLPDWPEATVIARRNDEAILPQLPD